MATPLDPRITAGKKEPCHPTTLHLLWGCVLTRPREIVRHNIPAFAFHILNWTFISFMQSILLFLITAPVYELLLATQFEPNLTSADVAYTSLELGLVLIEYIADQAQWGMLPYHAVRDFYHLTASLVQITTQPRVRTRRRVPSWPATTRPSSSVAS